MSKKKGDPIFLKEKNNKIQNKKNIKDDGDSGSESDYEESKKINKKKSRNNDRSPSKKTTKKSKTEEEVTIDLKSFLANALDDDVQSQKNLILEYKNYLNSLDWKFGLKKGEAIKYKKTWSDVCNHITDMPLISDIIKLNITTQEKAEFIHKLIILYGLSFDSFEFIQMRKILTFQYKKYQVMNYSDEELNEFNESEQNIIDTINTDLGIGDSNSIIKYSIINSQMSKKNKACVFMRYQQLALGEDNSKLKSWIQTALSVPTKIQPIFTSENSQIRNPKMIDVFLSNVKNILDEELYGMANIKEQLLFFINNKISNVNTNCAALALEGLPGIGKTCIVQALSKALNLPMACIPIGGAKDANFLTGHGFTYEGSTPGAIVQALQELKCINGIIFIDEIDKIPQTEKGSEISKALLHIIDPSQNFAYHDKYLTNQFDIDLSKIWFIYTLNDKNNIEKTLRDRIPIIHIDGYTNFEKIDIVKNFLIPKALKNVNISISDVIFNDDAIKYIIQLASDNKMEICDSNGRSGVRQVKYLIEYLVMKINLLFNLWDPTQNYKFKLELSFSIPNFKIPLIVTRDVINNLHINDIEKNKSWNHLSMYC